MKVFLLSDWKEFEYGMWRKVGDKIEVKISTISTSDKIPMEAPFGSHEYDFSRPQGYNLELISGTIETITHLPALFFGAEVPKRTERLVRAFYRINHHNS